MTAEVPPPGEYAIDPARSAIAFSAKHMFGLGTVRGGFRLRSGTISVAEAPADSHVQAVADAASFASGNAARDRKVRSKTFLDTDGHPDIGFTSTSAEVDADGVWRLHGLLTARGVQAPVVFTVTEAETLGDELSLAATATVDRHAHGITALNGMAGRHVHIDAAIRARRIPAGPPSGRPAQQGEHHMSDLKIAVILGSTRPGRNGKGVADWVVDRAGARTGAEYELVDLADYPLPHLDEAAPPSMGQYQGEHTKTWAAKIAEFDGYIFVTPEYNHSTSGVLKNAIDYLYGEWNNKAAAFVSYGALGGARAIEHLRAIASELQLAHVRQQLSFSLFTDFENYSVFKPAGLHDDAAVVLFEQLESWARALKTVRA
ncbi:NAD(P)H-dependent oxidoreductase [Actinoallomurus purpureus]|uniref:NAD(P)H-dependent oxidoreductase n=1 Tax=Actinoallomurus purpureus TaxID=478114 RepID=UPI0020931DAB|nr:NAD(P)H-dependent oxidoreductase [Actinoallomurus purpureus]MCO6008904.1 NAD(P)H-dependent oxidoreductase [Actinoallomurus purpureus]